MNKEITIGELNSIYEKYGDLNFKVETPYGYKDITWCGITEENADVYRCELEDGKYVEGADYHRLKKEDGDFVLLKEVEVGESIQTVNGMSNVKSIELMSSKDTLYDIQVAEVHQYYSNGIVSHNTTFSVDALKFLFFGRTTKTDKNEQIFNSYTDENELKVRGMIEFDGKEIIIERKMSRTLKKEGGWAVKNQLNYFELLPDGDEVLLNDEDSKASTMTIQNTIGSEKDFDITILATGGNLEDLIDSTPTESGKLLTKFIGLEIIELKEKSARDMYNEFAKTKTANIYDITTLFDEINDCGEKIELLDIAFSNQNETMGVLNGKLSNLNESKDIKLSSKKNVNEKISILNPDTLESKLSAIGLAGKNKNVEIANLNVEIKSLLAVDYDESKYFKLIEDRAIINNEISNSGLDKLRIEKLVSDLENGELCPTCSRPLEDVDHSTEIKDNKALLLIKIGDIIKFEAKLIEINKVIEDLNTNKLLVDRRMRLENLLGKNELELAQLKVDYVDQNKLLTEYNLNKDSIEFNLDVDLMVSKIKSDIQIEEYNKSELLKKISEIETLLRDKKLLIEKNNVLVSKIKNEEEVDKIFKVYIEMVGKKGISKLVLRSVLPIINSELYRLLDESCDFNIELIINSKNEVEYLLEKDDILKPLKSGSGLERTIASLALRCVLGKMSHLPMPNFITFDEVLGKIADINIEKLKPMFEKIRDMYEIVFLITHNDIVKDWSDNIISITKTDNISEIYVK